MVALLGELRRELGLALVFVARDLAVVRQVRDRVAVMRQGGAVEEAPVDEAPCIRQFWAAVPALDPKAAARRRTERRESVAA